MIMKPEIAVASSGQKAKLSADLDVKSYVKEPKRRVPMIDTADVVKVGVAFDRDTMTVGDYLVG